MNLECPNRIKCSEMGIWLFKVYSCRSVLSSNARLVWITGLLAWFGETPEENRKMYGEMVMSDYFISKANPDLEFLIAWAWDWCSFVPCGILPRLTGKNPTEHNCWDHLSEGEQFIWGLHCIFSVSCLMQQCLQSATSEKLWEFWSIYKKWFIVLYDLIQQIFISTSFVSGTLWIQRQTRQGILTFYFCIGV